MSNGNSALSWGCERLLPPSIRQGHRDCASATSMMCLFDSAGFESDRALALILPRDETAGRVARARVGDACDRWGIDDLSFTAGLCVAELATNAIKHVRWRLVPPGRPVWLIAYICLGVLVVEVWDPDPMPLPWFDQGVDWGKVADSDDPQWLLAESGRGLVMVGRVVDEADGCYGVEMQSGYKAVFFGLPVPGGLGPMA